MIVSDALDPYHADVDESMKLIAELFKKKFRFYIFASVHFGLNEGGQQAADRLKVRLEEEDIGLLIIDTSQGVDVSPLVFDALELCGERGGRWTDFAFAGHLVDRTVFSLGFIFRLTPARQPFH